MRENNKLLMGQLPNPGDIFTERMKVAMKQTSKKQIDIVRETGVDKGAISNYLKGKYKPNAETLLKIAHALNVTPEWLCGQDMQDTEMATDTASTSEQMDKVKEEIFSIIMRLHSDSVYMECVKELHGFSDEELQVLMQFIRMLRKK